MTRSTESTTCDKWRCILCQKVRPFSWDPYCGELCQAKWYRGDRPEATATCVDCGNPTAPAELDGWDAQCEDCFEEP